MHKHTYIYIHVYTHTAQLRLSKNCIAAFGTSLLVDAIAESYNDNYDRNDNDDKNDNDTKNDIEENDNDEDDYSTCHSTTTTDSNIIPNNTNKNVFRLDSSKKAMCEGDLRSIIDVSSTRLFPFNITALFLSSNQIGRAHVY